jgi:PAS domain S-box-containing protein
MTDPHDLRVAALQQAGDAIIVIDPEGVIRVWNDKAIELFGYTAEQVIGRDVVLIVPERLRDAHERGFSAAMASGHLASDGHPRRTKGIRADGEAVYVTMTFAVINDTSGRAIGSVAVARPYVREV